MIDKFFYYVVMDRSWINVSCITDVYENGVEELGSIVGPNRCNMWIECDSEAPIIPIMAYNRCNMFLLGAIFFNYFTQILTHITLVFINGVICD